MPNLFDLPWQAAAKVQQYAERGASELHYLRKIIESGTFRLENPLNYAAMASDIAKWGESGMLPSFNARRTPNRAAIIDDEGSFTYRELDEAANAVAHGLLAKGGRGGDGIAILARNHRWFAVAEFGCARVGARIILLNSSFSGPQIKEVSEREGAKLIIYDDEYTEDVSKADPPLGKLRALDTNPNGEDSGSEDETLANLVAAKSTSPAPKASKHSSIIILTSGPTGARKGASRSTPPTRAPIGGILSHVPFKANEVASLPAPMFHALGFLRATIGMFLGSTLVLHSKFKPDQVFDDIEKHKVSAVVVVPVMLARILDALEKMDKKPDLSSLRIIFASGAARGADRAERTL